MISGTAILQQDRNSTQAFDAERICALSLRRMIAQNYSQSQPMAKMGDFSGLTAPPQIDQRNVKFFSDPALGESKVKWSEVGTFMTCSFPLFDLTGSEQILWMSKVSNMAELPIEGSTGYLAPCVSYAIPLDAVAGGDWFELTSGFYQNMIVVCSEHRTEERKDTEIVSFLAGIYALAESNRVRQAAGKIMEYTDDLLLSSRFDACGHLLSQVDVDRLAKYPTLLVAFLGITLGAKAKLARTREGFYSSVESALSRELGPERAKRILRRFQ